VRLIWADDALDDLERIFDLNSSRSETFARRVDQRLVERAQDLCANPRIGRPTRRRNRFRLSVTDIQYVIDYEPEAGFIRILRIRSTREML
jgi:plasmid stabilization system protein ParE